MNYSIDNIVDIPAFYISTTSAFHDVEECMYLTHIGVPAYFARLVPLGDTYDMEIVSFFRAERPADEILDASLEKAYAFLKKYIAEIRALAETYDELRNLGK